MVHCFGIHFNVGRMNIKKKGGILLGHNNASHSFLIEISWWQRIYSARYIPFEFFIMVRIIVVKNYNGYDH